MAVFGDGSQGSAPFTGPLVEVLAWITFPPAVFSLIPTTSKMVFMAVCQL